MDFDRAAQRFARDQNKLRAQRQARQTKGTNLSAKAKREAEIRKQQQAKLLAERKRKQRQAEHIEQYMRQCDRNLRVKALSPSSSLQLQPTSIHGEGDKIALPPSVLEYLTASQEDGSSTSSSSSPWTFRIGILNPDYTFPQSPLLQNMEPPDADDEEDDDPMDDEEEDAALKLAPYRDELSNKYLALTHGTVVEFTQEEGHVGLPAAIARALIDQAGDAISVTRTVDPAGASASVKPVEISREKDDENDKDAMDTDNEYPQNDNNDDDGEKTTGHLAWGAFDLPDTKIEISLVQLPKGRACTLIPTQDALEKGFYNLKDIKLVLEQSLIRTRAVLSLNDVVHSWHRGVQYDVQVSQLEPADYHAVVCINTDITVEFGAPPEQKQEQQEEAPEKSLASEPLNDGGGYTLGGGRTLAEDANAGTISSQTTTSGPLPSSSLPDLPPEPPTTAPNTLLVQIRGPNGQAKRRFDVATSTLAQLFALASCAGDGTPSQFRLVTRFPRRVFTLNDSNASQTFHDAGLVAGQELFLVEAV